MTKAERDYTESVGTMKGILIGSGISIGIWGAVIAGAVVVL